MNSALWIVQGLLALSFLWTVSLRVGRGRAELSPSWPPRRTESLDPHTP